MDHEAKYKNKNYEISRRKQKGKFCDLGRGRNLSDEKPQWKNELIN